MSIFTRLVGNNQLEYYCGTCGYRAYNAISQCPQCAQLHALQGGSGQRYVDGNGGPAAGSNGIGAVIMLVLGFCLCMWIFDGVSEWWNNIDWALTLKWGLGWFAALCVVGYIAGGHID